MIRKSFILFFFFVSSLFASKLPEINSQDVVEMLHHIMEGHAAHKTLNTSLIQRALSRFLEELDPTKTYFLQSEVAQWENPPETLLDAILQETEKGSFTVFFEIHSRMLSAIERRNRLEEKVAAASLPKNVAISEFQNMKWTSTEDELFDRLVRIKALQMQAAERLEDPGFRDKALQRIAKRRSSREEEIASPNPLDRERFTLAHVLKAFSSAFDAHTSYFTPKEAAQFVIQLQQRLFGIGAQLRDDLNGFTIVKIIESGPASQTALKDNDRIIAIDGEPVVGLDILDAVELIRGEEGTPIVLTVLRPSLEGDEKLEIKLNRGEVVIKEARIESSIIPFADGVIARIALHAFYQDPLHSSSADLYEEIAQIRKEHTIKGLILDLRKNSGGVLPQAVAVTSLFITKGIVVSIKDNNGVIEHLRNIDGRTAYDGPLIILTSKASASAAEIVAQTLQDYGRAIVIGDEHTYGKGTFQTFTLDAANNGKINPKGEFKVTRGRYYTVSGKSPQLTGVLPDLVVPGFFSALEIGEQHALYPLDNDLIPENFHDDLSDIPVVQRDQISWLYRFNLQQRLKEYNRWVPLLKKNSKQRLEQNAFYQSFLKELSNENCDGHFLELFNQNDPQLQETINVMKDLIVLSQ